MSQHPITKHYLMSLHQGIANFISIRYLKDFTTHIALESCTETSNLKMSSSITKRKKSPFYNIAQNHRLGTRIVLSPRKRLQRQSQFQILQRSITSRHLLILSLLSRHLVPRSHDGWHDIQQITFLQRSRQLRPTIANHKSPWYIVAVHVPQ